MSLLRDRSLSLWIQCTCTTLVALDAAYASFRHGREFALRFDADATTATIWPLIVDGLVITATVELWKHTGHRTVDSGPIGLPSPSGSDCPRPRTSPPPTPSVCGVAAAACRRLAAPARRRTPQPRPQTSPQQRCDARNGAPIRTHDRTSRATDRERARPHRHFHGTRIDAADRKATQVGLLPHRTRPRPHPDRRRTRPPRRNQQRRTPYTPPMASHRHPPTSEPPPKHPQATSHQEQPDAISKYSAPAAVPANMPHFTGSSTTHRSHQLEHETFSRPVLEPAPGSPGQLPTQQAAHCEPVRADGADRKAI